MELNLSKVGRALLIVALMCTALPMVADAVIIPIANNLFEAFPNDTGAINFILSGPQLIVAISSLLAAPLMRFMGKKTLLVIFGVLCAVCLVFAVAIDNAYYTAVCRGVAGFCVGIINVVGLALIAEIFTDEKVYANLMGFYNAFMALAGTLFGFLTGFIALTGWKNVFYLYLVYAVCALAFIFFIPKAVNKKTVESSEANVKVKQESGEKGKLGISFWLLMVMLFLFMFAAMGTSYFISVYIAENGLGDEALSGTAASLYTLGSFLLSLIFGLCYGKVHRGVNAVALALGIVMIGMLIVTKSPFATCASSVLGGGAYGFAYAFALTHMPNIVPASKVDFGMSVIGFVVAISSFLATYFVTFLMETFGSFTNGLPVLLAISIAAVVFEVISILSERGKKTEAPADAV